MIKQHVITEKTARLAENNCYVFLVEDNTNKIELQKHIAKKYGVEVIKVNMLKRLGKKVRRGRITGRTSCHKKAYVFTKEPLQLEEGGS
jgi:large subunit ribosomal protein L23